MAGAAVGAAEVTITVTGITPGEVDREAAAGAAVRPTAAPTAVVVMVAAAVTSLARTTVAGEEEGVEVSADTEAVVVAGEKEKDLRTDDFDRGAA